MESLSDELLLESYYTACELKLSPDFISLFEEEIHKRSLAHKIKQSKFG
ncbi:sporulation histidine kinase inhibitor Sda [Oceanobacillus rekensis]|jgi:developmental checkpoint coupling sporulation initiation to replication initiation|nr:sporulation histidine kinase inhibitor Sda [Oceanobacillus rekensis]